MPSDRPVLPAEVRMPRAGDRGRSRDAASGGTRRRMRASAGGGCGPCGSSSRDDAPAPEP